MADMHPEVLRLLRERFRWKDAKTEDGGLRATAPMPNLGSLADYVRPELQADYFRFWVCEVLEESLLTRFRDEAIYPDKLPPSLRFVKAALEQHEKDRRSRAYLFCLNLLVIYALGWRPDRTTRPMLPLAGGEGASDQPWAQEAREHLVHHVLKRKFENVAREVFKQHAEGRLRHLELSDVEQKARIHASSLMAGESIEEMARTLVEGRADESDEETRPFEVRLIRALSEEYHRRKIAHQPTWTPGTERHEECRLAYHLLVGCQLRIQDILAKGERDPLKSFWPGDNANLITHLFGPPGRRGRLYQELRDWLKREAKRVPSSDSLDEVGDVGVAQQDIEGVDQEALNAFHEDSRRGLAQSIMFSGKQRKGRIRLDADAFHEVDWRSILGRAATPLNLAIMEGCWVENLEGRKLRMYLVDRGFGNLPSPGALRQRVRYLLSRARNHYRPST